MSDSNNIFKDKIKNLVDDTIETVDRIIYAVSEDQTLSDISDDAKDMITNFTIEKFLDFPFKLVYDIATNTVNTARSVGSAGLDKAAVTIDGAVKKASDSVFDKLSSLSNEAANYLQDAYNELLANAGEYGGGAITNMLGSIMSIIADGMSDYVDGVTETTFGALQENSWYGTNKSFLNYFKTQYKSVSSESKAIRIMNSTPLDSGDARSSLYGSMILGVPYTFGSLADPNNRTLINTFIKDGKILSLTPGMPKYNGLTSYADLQNSILAQTDTPSEMLSYLERNGLDRTFSDKDKRYYTFEAKYDEYFAYLETMLNAVWIKLGLAKDGNDFNIFSFFDLKQPNADSIDETKYNVLKPQYNSSIGFFTNIVSAVSESVDSQQTGFGSEMASRANANAQDYQKMNYITGMGTGSSAKNVMRKVGIGVNSVKQIKGLLSETFAATAEQASLISTKTSAAGKIRQVVKTGVTAAMDVVNFNNTEDIGAVMQSFATSNGMQVVYPELWSNSGYSKNMNFNFTFTSPYGDPLSIFKYVYVPFLTLACFSLPRQAAENGYVSPFFVRADIPGLVTSDLALISSFTFTKGGSSNLWTKDGLPRSIECSITISDLYPYLSMTKRLSFLSANPSYTVFLDNMAGMCALHDDSEDVVNDYFKALIDRANGTSDSRGSLWNKFNSAKRSEILRSMNSSRASATSSLSKYNIPWLHNSSI